MSNELSDADAALLRGKDRADYFRRWRTAAATDVKDFSLMGRYGQATATDHLKRAGSFMFGGGAASIGENVLNALGQVTKHQQNSWIARTIVPASGAYFAYDALSTGDYAGYTGFAGAEMAGLTAFRPAKEIGHAFAKGVLRMGPKSSWAFGALTGLTAGVAAGALIGGAAYGLAQIGSNENFIQDAKMAMTKPLFKTAGMQTENTMTARQRALGKLAKSGLNDRGSLLGSESMILRNLL